MNSEIESVHAENDDIEPACMNCHLINAMNESYSEFP